MSEHLIVIAQARAKTGSAEALIDAQRKLVEATRLAPGCLQYDLHRSTNEPDVVVFVETWDSEDAWHRHMRGAAIEEFRRTGGHLISDFQLQTLRKIA
jgi:quinol monooxygenase YgiN